MNGQAETVNGPGSRSWDHCQGSAPQTPSPTPRNLSQAGRAVLTRLEGSTLSETAPNRGGDQTLHDSEMKVAQGSSKSRCLDPFPSPKTKDHGVHASARHPRSRPMPLDQPFRLLHFPKSRKSLKGPVSLPSGASGLSQWVAEREKQEGRE